MKATVMENRGRDVVLLKKDGTFIKMKSGKLKIGDVVNVKESQMNKIWKFGAAAAIALLMGGGVYSYATPAYYVSLDVNPGVIMEVNMYDRVIGTEAVNEDGEAVIDGLDLENIKIEDAVTRAVERIDELGYFEDGGEILIGTISENEETAEEAAEELGSVIEEEIIEKEIDAEVTAKVVGFEMVKAAKAIEGMTPGKYNIIVNHLGIAPENAKDYVGTSVKEIMKEVKALRAQNKEEAEEHENETDTDIEADSETLVDPEMDNESEISVDENEVKSIKEKNVPENNGKSEEKVRNPKANPKSDKKAPDASMTQVEAEQNEVEENTDIDAQAEPEKAKDKAVKNEKPVKPETPEKSGKPAAPKGNRP